MHRFRTLSAIRRMRAAASILLLRLLVTLGAIGLLAPAVAHHDRQLMATAAVTLALLLPLSLLQWLVTSRASCPLCMARVMAKSRCVKHRRARPLLTSHRLRVALSILFKSRFQCPYCGESSLLKIRKHSVGTRSGTQQN